MKDAFDDIAGPTGADVSAPALPAARPVVTLDVALYERYLTESDMTDEQKREFLEMLWTIIVGFVDLGFGVDPVQQAIEAEGCGQNVENSGSHNAGLVSSERQLTPPDTTPNQQADNVAAVRKGRRT
ncbi:hypothetical protein [uncultured Devosia sp.]|uniref:hypothetical protein n=1 Tax=uncultured Devosia sp. TaxID=211434 RepID=UPI0035C958D0